MKYCKECGAQAADEAAFCPACGQPLNEQEENQRVCAKCGAKLDSDSVFCPSCGTKDDKKEKAEKEEKKQKIIFGVTAAVLGTAIIVLAVIAFRYMTGGTDIKTAAVTPSPMPSFTASPAPASTEAPQLVTYYAVNCNSHISLRQSPDTNSSVLKNIPLGDPVSFVEPAANGFAKVIYNGTEGYALQSYLSQTPPEPSQNSDQTNINVNVQAPDPNDTSGSVMHAAEEGVVTNPSYYTYSDSSYNFSCAYPSHFRLYNDSDSFVRYSLCAPDNSALLKICAAGNGSGRSPSAVAAGFKSSYPGSVEYEDSGSSWCAVRTRNSSGYHYCYFKLTDGMIRGFEFHSDSKYFNTYDMYINDIYGSLNFY